MPVNKKRSTISLGLSFFIHKMGVFTGKPNEVIFCYVDHSNKSSKYSKKQRKITSPNVAHFVDQT